MDSLQLPIITGLTSKPERATAFEPEPCAAGLDTLPLL